MIRTVIIDDEQHCIDRLRTLLTQNCGAVVNVEGTYRNVEDGVRGIREVAPAVVFLDVQLQGLTGFDLLQRVGTIDFEVIFTTAFEKYAVQAFKCSAVDYLLKPVDADDLLQAVGKLQQKISKEEISKKFDVLYHNLKNFGGKRKIGIPTVTGLVFLPVDDIIRCQSDINYTTLFLRDRQKLVVAKTLKEFEELLSDCDFFRVHNSHLVNLGHITSYHRGKGGFVTMSDNATVEVSTRRKDDLLKRLSAF